MIGFNVPKTIRFALALAFAATIALPAELFADGDESLGQTYNQILRGGGVVSNGAGFSSTGGGGFLPHP